MFITKIGRRLLSFFAVALLMFAVTACAISDEEKEVRNAAKSKAEATMQLIDSWERYDNITKNFQFATSETEPSEFELESNAKTGLKNNATASFSSSNPDVLEIKWIAKKVRSEIKDGDDKVVGLEYKTTYELRGIVKRPAIGEENEDVILKVKVSIDYLDGDVTRTVSIQKDIKFTILAETPTNVLTIGELEAKAQEDWADFATNGIKDKDGNPKSNVTVKGIVTQIFYGATENSFFISDENGDSLFIYSSDYSDVKLYDELEITGAPAAYYGSIQMGAKSSAVLISEGNDHPCGFEEIDIDEWYTNDINTDHSLPGKQVHVRGLLVKDGSNYKIVSEDSDKYLLSYYKSYGTYEQTLIESYLNKVIEADIAIYDSHSEGYWRYAINCFEYPIEEVQLSDEEKFNLDVASLNALNGEEYFANTDLEIPTETLVNGSTITPWVANVADVFDFTNGKVLNVAEDKEVQLSTTVSLGTLSQPVTITVTVKKSLVVSSIADVKAADNGEFKVEGTVIGNYDRGFLLKDETGVILVYLNKNYATKYNVGDQVRVSGTTSVYNNAKQFVDTSTHEKVGFAAYDAGTPTELQNTDLDAYLALTADEMKASGIGRYVKFKGTLTISGSYYNVAINEYTNMVGSLSYPINLDAALSGKTVVVEGYTLGISGSTTKYFNVMVKSVYEDGGVGPQIDPQNYEPIATVVEAPVGLHEVEGAVLAVSTSGFLLKDATGIMFVYAAAETSYVPGDFVHVKGTTVVRYDLVQFTNTDLTHEKTGKSVEYVAPTAVEWTATELNQYDARIEAGTYNEATAFGPYITVKAKLSVSGNYYNLAIDGFSKTGSISYPQAALMEGFATDDVVIVEGYAIGYTGSTKGYFNILATKVSLWTDPSAETVKSIVEGEAGAHTLTGTVIATNTKSFLVKDTTGVMMVYLNAQPACVVGDVVEIVGTTEARNGLIQFKSDATVTVKESSSYSAPKALEWTATELNEYDAMATYNTLTAVGKYVKLQGVYTISGNYYNFAVEGFAKTVSIQYPDAALFEGFTSGDTVVIEGYIVGFTNSGKTYLGIMLTKVSEVGQYPTLAEVIAADLGAHETQGTVIAKNTKAFLLQDESATMMVYVGEEPTCAVGDVVKVSGTTADYRGAVQFGNDSEVTVLSSGEYTAPEVQNYDYVALEAYKAATYNNSCIGQYVSVTGIFTVSGNYYNLVIEGLSFTGSVLYPDSVLVEGFTTGTEVTVTGYIAGYTNDAHTYLGIMVTGIVERTAESTVAEIVNAEAGTKVAEGLVVATNEKSFLLQDETGTMMVYLNKKPEVKVGNYVVVNGTTEVRNSLMQFKSDATITVLYNKTYENPTALEWAATELNEYDAMTTYNALTAVGKYVKLQGVYTISGSYYNFAVEGFAKTVSIQYPDAALFEGFTSGDTVVIEGYIVGFTNSGKTYLGIMLTKVSEVGAVEPEELYKTGFETSSKEGTSNDYMNDHEYTIDGKAYKLVHAEIVTTGSPKYGAQQITLRYYKNKTDNCFLTLQENLASTKYTEIGFAISGVGTLSYKVSYSTDSGTSWVVAKTEVCPTSWTNVQVEIEVTGTIRIQIEVFATDNTSTGSNRDVKIDELYLKGIPTA